MTTTLSSFLSDIAPGLQAPLVFSVENTTIRPEYHVTEVKLAHVRALDCGLGKDEWDETLVQLLDGPLQTPDGGKHMSAEKFTKIAAAGLKALGAPANGELFFEWAPANAAARKLVVHSVEHVDDCWHVRLSAVTAVCKPSLRQFSENQDSRGSCCDADAMQSMSGKSCCAPANSVTACCSR